MIQIFVKKCRKEHKCSCCGRVINKGESYTLIKERMPDYGLSYFSPQKGIFFSTNKFGHNCDNLNTSTQ